MPCPSLRWMLGECCSGSHLQQVYVMKGLGGGGHHALFRAHVNKTGFMQRGREKEKVTLWPCGWITKHWLSKNCSSASACLTGRISLVLLCVYFLNRPSLRLICQKYKRAEMLWMRLYGVSQGLFSITVHVHNQWPALFDCSIRLDFDRCWRTCTVWLVWNINQQERESPESDLGSHESKYDNGLSRSAQTCTKFKLDKEFWSTWSWDQASRGRCNFQKFLFQEPHDQSTPAIAAWLGLNLNSIIYIMW